MGEIIKSAVKNAEAKRENRFSQPQKTGPSQSISSPVEQILFLQRTVGNKAVGRLLKSGALQAKLTVNPPVQRQVQGEETSAGEASHTDLSDVNIHVNSKSADDIGALAYTQGRDIHFAAGQFKPDTAKGRQLLGHELTHVAQQSEGRVSPTTQIGGLPVNDNPQLEKEADEGGRKMGHINWSLWEGGAQRKSPGQESAANSVQRMCGVIQRNGLTISSDSFSAGSGGAITATPGASNVTIQTPLYNPSGKAEASGGTDADAQDWEAGFVQTMKSANRMTLYIGSPTQKTKTVTIPGPRRDAFAQGGEPWYDPNNANDSQPVAFATTNSKINVQLKDSPFAIRDWDTPDSKGKLDRHEGKDTFAAWMIARKRTAPNTIQYLNWTSWEVDWGVTFNYASKGAKTADKITGQTKNTGSGAGKGSETPVLSGTIANSEFSSAWS